MPKNINQDIRVNIRTMLFNIEDPNKVEGIDYSDSITDPKRSNAEINVAKEHEEFYKELLDFKAIFEAKESQRITYKDSDDREAILDIPSILEGEKDSIAIIDIISEKFNDIQKKFSNLNISDDKKERILPHLKKNQDILSSKNIENIKKSIKDKSKTNETSESKENEEQKNEAIVRTPSNKKKKVIKKEEVFNKFKQITYGKLNEYADKKNWSKFKKTAGKVALTVGIGGLAVLGTGLLINIAKDTIAVIGGVGTIVSSAGVAGLAPLVPPLISLASVAALITCTVAGAHIYKKYKTKKEQEKIEKNEQDKEQEQEQKNEPEKQKTEEQSKTVVQSEQNKINSPAPTVQNKQTKVPNPVEPSPSMTDEEKEIQLRNILINQIDKVKEAEAQMSNNSQKIGTSNEVEIGQETAKINYKTEVKKLAEIIRTIVNAQELEQQMTAEETSALGGR